MAALSKRDIEMIFRAETDAAQRPVNALTADVKNLRQTLEGLAKSSDKTEKSLDDLAATTRQLEQAQSELATSRTLLTQLNAQASAVERAEAAVDKATAKYEQLKLQVDGAEKPTKRLTTSLAAAERGLASNNARLDEARQNYQEVKTSIESILGPVDNLQDAFRAVAVAQRDVTQGLATAKDASADFNRALVADSKSLNDQIRLEEQTLAAQRKNAALEESARKTRQLGEIETILRGNQQLEQQFRDLAASEQRLGQVDAFRQIAAQSAATVSATERMADSLQNGTTSAQRLADAVLGIVNPAQQSATTLDGMDDRLTSVIAKLSSKNISAPEWGYLNNELQAIQAGLISVSAEVDKFNAQQARVDDSAQAYDRQAQKVRELAAAQITASTNVEELTADLMREERALTGLGTALDRETAKLREMGTALQRVGVDSNQLPAAIQRIEASATRAAPAIQRVSNVLSPNGSKGFLGLDPYQLQNFSFQMNDVISGLAMGQPPMQVFLQQAGQIVQIFPGLISGFLRFAPVLLPVGVALGVVAGALGEANDQLKTMKTAQTVLASLGETNGYDVGQFAQIVEQFKNIGVAAEEANEAAKIFVTEGLNPAAVDDYIIAAKNLATVQGIDVKEATEELTGAFTRGAEEVLSLDDKYHFLTDTQRENLIASKDTKNEYIEVNKAFTALYTKMQEGAAAAEGPMTNATNTLRGAWRQLLNTFADTGIIESVTNFIANAVLGFSHLINVARRSVALFKGAGEAYAAGGGGFLGAARAAIQIGQNIGNGGVGNVMDLAMQDTQRQMAGARLPVTRPQSAPGADAGAGSRGRQGEREDAAEKARKQAAKDAKKAAKDAEAERKRREREAAQLAKQYANESDQLSAALSRATAQAMRGTQAPLEQQLDLAKQAVDEQFKALEDRLSEFREKFGDKPINGMSQTEYAAALAAQKNQIVQAKQLEVFESNINELLRSRDEKLRSIRDQQSTGLIDAQTALEQTREVTSTMGPQIDAAIDSARTFIAALKPSSETQALLDKFSRIQQQSSGPQAGQTIVRRQAETGLNTEERKVNEIFERRAALIEAANRLYEIGAINFTERENRIKGAFESTNEALTAQIELLRQYLETNKGLFEPEVYERAMANLQEFGSRLGYVSTMFQAVRDSAEQAIAGGIMSMFDTLAQGIANIITGAGSLKDLFSDLGRAALDFAAQFLQSIAQAIMQIYALRIAKSLVGGFHGGGTVGDYGGGQMRLSRNIGMPDLSAVPRYHNGTAGAGLKSNEMLAVLEKGEKVSTEEQQRLEANRLKAAQSSGGGSLRQVLAFGDEEIAAAMQGTAGESVTVTHIRRNAPLIKQLLRD